MKNRFLSSSIYCLLILTFFSCKPQSTSVSESANITVEEARKIQGKPGIIFLDVRTPKEIANGKIEGALELDYKSSNFKEELNKLDKSKQYVVYCRSGGRSSSTLDLMKKNGFSKSYNMLGGYTAWSSSEN